MKINDRVHLNAAALVEVWKFRDIGTRPGTVKLIDGWIIVAFDGVPEQIRLPETDLERIEP